MEFNRRRFLKTALSTGLLAALPKGVLAAGKLKELTLPVLDAGLISGPVKIVSIEYLRNRELDFIRAESTDGVVGIALTNNRLRYFGPMLRKLVMPYFLGKDIRQLESLVDGVYTHKGNYKFSGLAFWNCVAAVESALLDVLGKTSGKSVGQLLGGVIRREVQVHISSMRRDTTPEQEVAWLTKRLTQTGAKAVKIKVGGRMSNNADAKPGRTENLIRLARKTFGDSIDILADANGSYDARKGIEVGKLLEAHNGYFFEEPCPFELFEETKQVADALKMPVAGGEQDFSMPKFKWMIENRGVDIVQPDLHYNGGFIRTIRIARMAEAAGMSITVHSSKYGAGSVYMLQFASCVPNIGKYQEYNGAPHKIQNWCEPILEVENGAVKVPTGPGLGITIDPELIKNAKPVVS
ncbi:MAG: mandelate racemase/muconate lactonizing enzyme family protein [Planctomycetes bacterium]|nr:mandelate racemase/muconate lactonizing enzyme family protein [Planctomycetota bacterium]